MELGVLVMKSGVYIGLCKRIYELQGGMFLIKHEGHVLVHETEPERSDASSKGTDDSQGTKNVIPTKTMSRFLSQLKSSKRR